MKTKLISLLTLLFCFTTSNHSFSQARDFDGLWSGNVNVSDGSVVEIQLYIEDNNVYATHIDSDGDLAKDLSKEITWSGGYGQQLNFIWEDAGGAWNETQIFSLVWISSSKLSVYYTRHVSNNSEDSNGNTDWGVQGNGYLTLE